MVRSFCYLNENATINNAGVKVKHCKTWICLGSNIVITQHNLAIIRIDMNEK